MNLIYGDVRLARKENNNLYFVWYVSFFNELPVEVREQLVKLMLENEQTDDVHFCKTITTLANERANCALHALISRDGTKAQDGIGYTAEFNGRIMPAIGVLEIINWVSWGIKLEDEVYQTAQTVLDIFLQDAPAKPSILQSISAKKKKLAKQAKSLEKRINALMKKSIELESQLLTEKHANRVDIAKANQAEIIQKQIYDLNNQLIDVFHLQGQAEVYPLVKK